jgi:cellulose synthase/poly-beta-1,6-N-acetylglucosamine synthase-like glycosyltransferase
LLFGFLSVCAFGAAGYATIRIGASGSIGLYVLACLFGSIDLCDLALRLYFRRAHTKPRGTDRAAATSLPLEVGTFTPRQVRHHLQPYAIVVSVYNAEDELDDFLENIGPYRERVWVIDDASTDETFARLQHAGIRCIRGTVNRKKPGALKALVAALDPAIETVVVLDPDSRILNTGRSPLSDLDRVVFEFQRSGMAAMCPRLAIRDENYLARFQQLEFFLSFTLGRYSLGDHCITSGIAVYRRDALVRVLDKHSLSVYAEDLKNAYLLLSAGERIYYDGRLTVETAGKRTWGGWFSQRVAWYFGLFKVYVEALPDLVKCSGDDFFFKYHFLLYTGIFGILLHPLKLLSCSVLAASLLGGLDEVLNLGAIPQASFTDPTYFLVAYTQSTLLVVLALAAAPAHGGRRALAQFFPAIPLYFFYSVLHTAPITLGYLNWFSLRFAGRRLYRDHFQDDVTLRQQLLGT